MQKKCNQAYLVFYFLSFHLILEVSILSLGQIQRRIQTCTWAITGSFHSKDLKHFHWFLESEWHNILNLLNLVLTTRFLAMAKQNEVSKCPVKPLGCGSLQIGLCKTWFEFSLCPIVNDAFSFINTDCSGAFFFFFSSLVVLKLEKLSCTVLWEISVLKAPHLSYPHMT